MCVVHVIVDGFVHMVCMSVYMPCVSVHVVCIVYTCIVNDMYDCVKYM